MIADEPASGLDATLVDRTAGHLLALTERGAAVLVITHDLELAQRLGGITSVLYASYLVEQRPTADLFAGPAHPYVTALLDARPQCGAARSPPETGPPDRRTLALRWSTPPPRPVRDRGPGGGRV